MDPNFYFDKALASVQRLPLIGKILLAPILGVKLFFARFKDYVVEQAE